MTAPAAAALTAQQRALLDVIVPSTQFTPEAWRLHRFGQWRRVFRASFPDATDRQHDLAMTAIAQRVGIAQ